MSFEDHGRASNGGASPIELDDLTRAELLTLITGCTGSTMTDDRGWHNASGDEDNEQSRVGSQLDEGFFPGGKADQLSQTEADQEATGEQTVLLRPEVATPQYPSPTPGPISVKAEDANECDSDDGRYATTRMLGKWIPKVDPAKARTFSRKLSERRNMLLRQLLFATIAFLILFAFTIWATISRPVSNGVGTLNVGDCSEISVLDSGIHACLNILSTMFLGAGNYCLQILVAPSKNELREAHLRGNYYDIGVHSVRNLRHIRKTRVALWSVLGLTSTALHLLLNSCFFTSLPFVEYPAVLVTSDFLSSRDDWNLTSQDLISDHRTEILSLHVRAANFTRLTNKQCLEHSVSRLTATSELVLVSNWTAESHNQSSFISTWTPGADGPHWDDSYLWICFYYEGDAWATQCDLKWALTWANDWIVKSYGYNDGILGDMYSQVLHCLSGEEADMNQRCALHYSQPLLTIVCVCMFVDMLIIAGMACAMDTPTLTRLGDAVSELLEEYNVGIEAPLADHDTVLQPVASPVRLQIQSWPDKERPLWFKAVSKTNWMTSISVIAALLIAGISLLAYSLATRRVRGLPITLPSLQESGLGRVQRDALIGGPFINGHGTWTFAGHVILANAFQILISFAYLFYNNIWTRQLIADELLRFLSERKALRVSEPRNDLQRSSYFLSLPWKYAVPQMTAFALLHWFISQSIFIVQTDTYGPGPQGARIPANDGSRLGYSAIGIFYAILVGAVLLFSVLAHSFRRYPVAPTDFVEKATNSAFLAALCCRPRGDTDAHLYPVQLGAVAFGVKTAQGCRGRITFSSDCKLDSAADGEVYEYAVYVKQPEMDGGRMSRIKSKVLEMLPSLRERKRP